MKNGFCYLTDLLPSKVGANVLDSRACTAIAVINMMADECSNAEKAIYASGKLFHKAYQTALDDSGLSQPEFDSWIVDYLAGPPEVKSWKELHQTDENAPRNDSSKKADKERDFDFVQDSDAIVACFRQVYGMSLDEVCNCHWWEFLALFRNIPLDGNAFSEIRMVRTRKPRKTDTPEQRLELAKAKSQVKLKDTRSPEKRRKDTQEIFDNLEI